MDTKQSNIIYRHYANNVILLDRAWGRSTTTTGTRTSMKLTYIYLTENEITTLKKTCNKYKVSMSTLADVVIFVTYYVLTHYGKLTNDDIEQNYIIKSSFTKRTTIKPKCLNPNEVLGQAIKKKDTYSTNALMIYANKRIEDYVTDEGKNHYYNMINEKLNQIREQFWDYNNFVRSQTRFIKKNPQYAKRLIAESEIK